MQRRLAQLAARAGPYRPGALLAAQPAADRPAGPGPSASPVSGRGWRWATASARANAAASASGRAASRRRRACRRDATPAATPTSGPKALYKLEAVFSQAQVEPLPPPAQPVPLEDLLVPLTGDELAWTLAPLGALARELGVSVEDVALPEGFDGFYDSSLPRCRATVRGWRAGRAARGQRHRRGPTPGTGARR